MPTSTSWALFQCEVFFWSFRKHHPNQKEADSYHRDAKTPQGTLQKFWFPGKEKSSPSVARKQGIHLCKQWWLPNCRPAPAPVHPPNLCGQSHESELAHGHQGCYSGLHYEADLATYSLMRWSLVSYSSLRLNLFILCILSPDWQQAIFSSAHCPYVQESSYFLLVTVYRYSVDVPFVITVHPVTLYLHRGTYSSTVFSVYETPGKPFFGYMEVTIIYPCITMGLKFLSFNMKGLNSPFKRKALNKEAAQSKADVIFA